MTGAQRDPGTSANFRYTTSTDMTYRSEIVRTSAQSELESYMADRVPYFYTNRSA